MNKELCFNIENKNLYLEQVLVDYMDIPIFFLCRGENQYYVTLCTDIDELSYIVAKLSLSDVYNLLHGKIPMRDVTLKQNEYWDIVSGNEIYLDTVTKKSIDVLETALMPEENACFKIKQDSFGKNGVKRLDFENNYELELDIQSNISQRQDTEVYRVTLILKGKKPEVECVVLPAFNINNMLEGKGFGHEYILILCKCLKRGRLVNYSYVGYTNIIIYGGTLCGSVLICILLAVSLIRPDIDPESPDALIPTKSYS